MRLTELGEQPLLLSLRPTAINLQCDGKRRPYLPCIGLECDMRVGATLAIALGICFLIGKFVGLWSIETLDDLALLVHALAT